ncbi:MAG TPA: flavodoxin/nitric oxide synthase [Coriobacteriia bacterium]
MKAVVVYESLWGNTAAVGRAIAEGIGSGATVLTTDQATPAALEGAELIVAGAPLLGFALPTDEMRANIRANPGKCPAPPDLAHPSMRSWLDALPNGTGRAAAFETRIWWSPGSAAKTILEGLTARGYRPAGDGQRFIVAGRCGPLRDGELEKARAWGAELARATG